MSIFEYFFEPSQSSIQNAIVKLDTIAQNIEIIQNALLKSENEIARLRAMNKALIDRIVIEAQKGNCTKEFADDMIKILNEGIKQC
jgi:hypothetical protein